MKRIMCFLLCVFLVLALSGCTNAKDGYTILPMEKADGKVYQTVIDTFLTDNEDYSNYEVIKKNRPDILSHLVNITPEALKRKCSIYRFTYESFTGLAGETFLIYGGEVYPIGCALGGYGITEFAYMNKNGKDVLYFIYSFGSGIHRSHIGAFDFKTKKITDYGGSIFEHQDIAFSLSKDGKTLGICKAQIHWPDWNEIGVMIDRGEILVEDISTFDFKPMDAEK